MLDDINYIEQFDRSNLVAIMVGQAHQLRQRYDVEAPVVPDLRNIVVVDPHGSGLVAEFTRSWLRDRLPIPVEVVCSSNVPAYVDERSLVIIYSYSGSTDEAVAALGIAKKRDAHLIIVTSDSALEKAGHALIRLPDSLPPAAMMLLEVKALASLLEHLGLVEGITDELEAQADWLATEASAYAAAVSTRDNLAKQMAEALVGHPVVVQSGPMLAGAAMKWKAALNENAQNQAFYSLTSGINSDEFLSWHNPKNTMLRVVQLQSSLDTVQIKKRLEASNRLHSGVMPAPIIVQARGKTKLQQMLWAIMLGDFASIYLAILNGVDPSSTALIEKLDKEMR